MREANCPSCGASIPFHAGSSVFAICGYCQAMVLRKGVDLENLGKISEVMEDGSPIRLGMRGRFKGRGFSVTGRIQLRWSDGFWNEWHLLYDDNTPGWLGEGSGMFFATFERPAPPGVIPAFDSLSAGQDVTISGKPFNVSWKETSRCVSGEGELPFAVHEGWESPSIDLIGPDGAFVTFDYSDDPPSLYVGEEVKLEALALDDSAAVAPKAKRVEAESLSCLSCGAPYAPHGKDSASWACPSCGSVHEVLAGKLGKIYASQTPPGNPPGLQTGMVGRFEEIDWIVVGVQRRKSTWKDEDESDGWATGASWDEYLLWNEKSGYRWLVESDGHWNWIRTVAANQAKSGQNPVMPGAPTRNDFRHFSTYHAVTTWVAGEFYWQVKAGDKNQVTDHVSPPWVLTNESDQRESIWSIGRYLERTEIAKAFQKHTKAALKLPPPPNTICANQPNPYAAQGKAMKSLLWKFMLLALVVHVVVSCALPSGKLGSGDFQVGSDTAATSSRFAVGPFAFSGARGNLEVDLSIPGLSNDWVAVDAVLTDRVTGRSWNAGKEISYYWGSDADGAWSEGSRKATLRFDGLEKGEYLLELETGRDPSRKDTVALGVEVRSNGGSPAWLVLAMLLIGLFPLAAIWRSHSFETRRWAESDHATGSDE